MHKTDYPLLALSISLLHEDPRRCWELAGLLDAFNSSFLSFFFQQSRECFTLDKQVKIHFLCNKVFTEIPHDQFSHLEKTVNIHRLYFPCLAVLPFLWTRYSFCLNPNAMHVSSCISALSLQLFTVRFNQPAGFEEHLDVFSSATL